MSSFFRFQDLSAKLRPGQIAMGLLEALPDIMFWVKDDAGVIVFANRAYAQLLNRTPEDLVGETDETLFPPTMANFFRSDDERIIKTSEPLQNKLEIVTRPGGGIEWRMTSKIPLFDDNDKVLGTAGVSRRLEHGEGPPLPTPQRAISNLIDRIHHRPFEDLSLFPFLKPPCMIPRCVLLLRHDLLLLLLQFLHQHINQHL